MFSKILIANRGEIACRIVRTARRMGIATVAVYSEPDAGARHVAEADEAVLIGPAAAAESYLDGRRLIAAAKATGAEAVHPGYGFLAENADFARDCGRARLVFIGPPAKAIRAMGSKSAAKTIMARAGVPLVPGYHGDDQRLPVLRKAAEETGYPVLIKASTGGGGKGMRVVGAPGKLKAALASARREARNAFGDDRVLIEKYLTRPRHIEVQVFADQAGRMVHLFERECSIQRRHQKVIEEAPAPGMDPGRRAEMGRAALAAAEAIGYVGAGTVEFIVDRDGAFYFMEMNTRLQVEHPVTEMITGQDLVEWQLRVAAGEPLPLAQEEIHASGHAIEARLYAEDPGRDFLPATGRLAHLRFPAEDAHVRVDPGVREGDQVSVHYDPLLAKLIVWDRDRPAALRRLRAALAAAEVVRVTTNAAFLSAVANHPAFAQAKLDTGFIERHRAELLPEPGQASERVLALACLKVLLDRAAEVAERARRGGDPHSPWNSTSGWRLNDDSFHRIRFLDGEAEREVIAHFRPGGYVLELPSGALEARGELDEDGALVAEIGGARTRARVVRHGGALTVIHAGGWHELALEDPLAAAAARDAGAGRLTAPMPGTVIEVKVKPGAAVEAGAPLLVLEAMKMEHSITAPADGVVRTMYYGVGDRVEEGAELVDFEAAEGGSGKG